MDVAAKRFHPATRIFQEIADWQQPQGRRRRLLSVAEDSWVLAAMAVPSPI